MNDINQFPFYKNYYDLLDNLPIEDKRLMLEVIVDYMFKGIEPNNLEKMNLAIWNNIKMPLANVKKNIENGQKGGRPKKEEKQNPNNNPNNNPIKNPNNNPKQKQNSIFNFKFYISNLNINNNIKDILYKWLEYKQDIKDMYKSETSIKTLVNQVIKNCETYGDDKVIEIINESISNGYKGIIFNKLKQDNNRYKTQSQRNKEFFDKMRKELEDGEKESN